MPSFDIVSEVDNHEVSNAVDQANREITTRFDFKDSGAKFELKEKDDKVILTAPNEFQVKQMQEILQNKFVKRGLDLKSLKFGDVLTNLAEARQEATVQKGIAMEFGKKLTKLIKGSNVKVQASIQGDQVRVTGKKRDDLQEIIAILREEKLEQAVQFTNFRD